MLYRKVPKNGDNLSALGFGMMRLPLKNNKIDEERAKEQLLYAIDNGVNYLDTAWIYHNGDSERFLGRALPKEYRDKVKIATKLPQYYCNSRKDMDYYLGKQLEKLKIEKIDYYLVHAINGGSWDKMKGLGIHAFLDEAKRSGKIVNAGFSFHGSMSDFPKIVDDYNWDFCQIQYNILDENYQAGKSGLKYAASKNLAVIIMEPLRGGMLANKVPDEVKKIYNEARIKRSNVEWALKWIWNQPEVTVVLSGMNEEEHIKENIKIASETPPNGLNEEENSIIKKASDTYKSLLEIGCTSCQYCMPCPMGVDIPSCFAYYNTYKMFDKKMSTRMFYTMQLGGIRGAKTGLASQCIECGKCLEQCPQNIDIPKQLKKVKKEVQFSFTPTIANISNAAVKVKSKFKK